MTKKICLMSLALLFLLAAVSVGETKEVLPEKITVASQKCIACHKNKTPGLYNQWNNSAHHKKVGCYECHQAVKGEPDAFSHYGKIIATIVSPNDCARCHQKDTKEFSESAHANAACLSMEGKLCKFLINNVLNLSGKDAFKTPGFPDGISAHGVNGCYKCHGYEVRVDAKGKLDPATWPNTGMGRINPDGSKGNCAACHMSHEFSRTQARRPESCSVCHSISTGFYGYQVYEGSRHGVSYATNMDKMHLDSTKWIVGETYSAAPTCATCHISPSRNLKTTHNISDRRLMPRMVPTQMYNVTCVKECPPVPGKTKMDDVCLTCHSPGMVKNFKVQVKGELKLFKKKWLEPGYKLYCKSLEVYKEMEGKSYRPFTHSIDWTWLETGLNYVNANIAVSMMSQQYTNKFNLTTAESWYNEFIPQVRDIIQAGMSSQSLETQKRAIKLEILLNKTLDNKDLSFGPGWPVDEDAAVTGCETKKK